MKRTIFLCLLAIVFSACTSSPSKYEQGLINYNGEWITVEEYEQIKSGEQPSTPTPKPEPTISFQILSIEQNYYEALDEWDTFVTFSYLVSNTGSIHIDYYEVSFTAICANGKEFYDWTNGTDLATGEKNIEENLINVGGLNVIDIRVNEWGFDPYSVNHRETPQQEQPNVIPECGSIKLELIGHKGVQAFEFLVSPSFDEIVAEELAGCLILEWSEVDKVVSFIFDDRYIAELYFEKWDDLGQMSKTELESLINMTFPHLNAKYWKDTSIDRHWLEMLSKDTENRTIQKLELPLD